MLSWFITSLQIKENIVERLMVQIKNLREKNQKSHERVSIRFKAYLLLLNIYTNALKFFEL